MKDSALVNGVVISREQAEKALQEMNKLSGGDIVSFNGRKAIVAEMNVAAQLGGAFWPHSWQERIILITLEDGGVIAPNRHQITPWKD